MQKAPHATAICFQVRWGTVCDLSVLQTLMQVVELATSLPTQLTQALGR